MSTLGALGIEIDRVSGDEAWALCPAHETEVGKSDTHASWSINLQTGAHFCFSCGWGGPFIRLVKYVKDANDDEAGRWIKARGGIEVVRRKLEGKGYRKPKPDEVTEADFAFYIDPPKWALTEKDLNLGTCREYGLRWDPDHDRWIIPIREPYTGKLWGWQEKGKNVFLNHPEHVEKGLTLFGFDVLLATGSRTAYLEESPLDAGRLHTYSLDTPVSSYGAHVSEAQIRLLADNVDRLVVCLDNDATGRARERKIWREYRHWFKHMDFANYDGIEKKDHGEMTPEQIDWSLEHAISKLRYRP